MVTFELYFVRLLCYWFFTLPFSQFCRVFCVFPSTDSLSDDNFVFRTRWSLLSKSDSNVLPKRTDVLYHVFANSCTVFKAAQRQPHSRNYVFIKLDADLFGKRGTSIIIATGLRELFLFLSWMPVIPLSLKVVLSWGNEFRNAWY